MQRSLPVSVGRDRLFIEGKNCWVVGIRQGKSIVWCMASPRILVVDDEPDLLDLVRYNLEREGYRVSMARDGVEALHVLSITYPDLVILDVLMPRMDGMELCKMLRRRPEYAHIPVLMLTAKTGEGDEVEGLDAGADDYLPKPVSPRRLLSRVRALLRRSNWREAEEKEAHVLRRGPLVIDRERYLVIREREGREEVLRLPRKEFELLFFLASHPGRVFSRQALLDHVWGPEVFVVDRTVDVHVRKIREKIGDTFIETVKGVGYAFRNV